MIERENYIRISNAKHVFTIFFFALISMPLMAQQATATMKISVNIVSGTTLNEIQALNIGSNGDVLNEGYIDLITPPSLDAEITVDKNVLLQNENGDQIIADTDSSFQRTESRLQVAFGADIKSQFDNAKGHYSGNVTTVVSYF